ncbi:MAG TPA: DUF4252 domain-containing protein [Bacteroidales bacterium]|nr:hypothetical protein [Rikenellaceae bacterium]HON53975.1 DUF4252 domain-containing protein [Bacteroidales bacterium]HRR49180.1 DUF4252 domain-containing protein [Bacteroidales bacterium]HRT33795.1 DUF4252 domain-containing protein [Bacteroidales bacterium]HRT83492.1 DUF4252 domain-containing protein [Bacteroidales bacterium]
MNKSAILAVLLFIFPSWNLLGQTKQLDKIFSTYENYKNVQSVSINPAAFFHLSEETKSNELLSKMSLLKILNVTKGGNEKDKNVWINLKSDVEKFIRENNFSQILKVKDKDELLEMYSRKEDNSLLLLTADSQSEYAVFYIQGDIDKSVIDALMKGNIKIKK